MQRFGTTITIIAVVAALLAAAPGVAGATACTATRSGSTVSLEWVDTGGTHVLRRNGSWLATPGRNTTSYIDRNAPVGATYELRTWADGTRTDTSCLEGAGVPTPTAPGAVTTVLAPTTVPAPAPPPAPTSTPALADPSDGCVLRRSGSRVELRWADTGGRHVIRRNGSWLTTIGSGDRYTDATAPPGAAYIIRTWRRGSSTDVTCTEETTATPTTFAPPTGDGTARRVLHISIDGLRSDHVTTGLTSHLVELIDGGASTRNARTDRDLTKTLPNHTSQYTGRPVFGSGGHHVDFNEDNLQIVDDVAGSRVDSVFDVVDANGGHTAVFAGKSKFDFLHRTWRDSIDTYRRGDPATLVDDALAALRTGAGPAFVSYHIRLPDSAGHATGWSSPGYDDAVRAADGIVGRLLDGIRSDRGLSDTTAIIVTSDHGGPNTGLLHDDASLVANYTVPFIVWGPGVGVGVDLYSRNRSSRTDPGLGRPGNDGVQPIRGHEMANLSLDLLGLPPVPGSTSNRRQDLRVD